MGQTGLNPGRFALLEEVGRPRRPVSMFNLEHRVRVFVFQVLDERVEFLLVAVETKLFEDRLEVDEFKRAALGGRQLELDFHVALELDERFREREVLLGRRADRFAAFSLERTGRGEERVEGAVLTDEFRGGLGEYVDGEFLGVFDGVEGIKSL